MANSIWSDEGRRRWPRDPSGYLFLGRAVDRLGEVMFPGRWRQDDPSARLSERDGGPRLVSRAPEPPRGLRELAARQLVSQSFLDQIAKGCADQAAVDAAARDAVERFIAVRERIISEAERGDLCAAYPNDRTGDMVDIPKQLWNTPQIQSWFAGCRVLTRREKPPIFLHRRSFEWAVSGKTEKPVGEQLPPPVRRGRRPTWDWKAMTGELMRIADEDGLHIIGSQQSDLERWAAEWFERRSGGRSPSESAIREHIAPIYQAKDQKNDERRSGR